MNYLDTRYPEQIALHNICSKEIPDFLLDFLKVPEIQRLDGISQNCGVGYAKLINYSYFLSRLDHSLGVALIVWNFTKDIKQTISGLLHDISNTVFSHVGDFINNDHEKQESTEDETSRIIRNSKELLMLLEKYKIKPEEVEDYKIYPIADNDSPRLAADRLEYSFCDPLCRQKINLDEINKIYNNISILKNEDDLPELGFRNIEIAERFSLLTIKNDRECFASDTSNLCMSFLAKLIKKMYEKGLISPYDLFTKTDREVIDCGLNCDDKNIKNAWAYYLKLDKFTLSEKPIEDCFCVNINVKKRYVNPLVKTDSSIYRISSISSKVKAEIEDYKASFKDYYICVDFSL